MGIRTTQKVPFSTNDLFFGRNKKNIFLETAQNVDSSEPPHFGSYSEFQCFMVLSRNEKNNLTPLNARHSSFNNYKVTRHYFAAWVSS